MILQMTLTYGFIEYWLIMLVFTLSLCGASYDLYKGILKRFPDDPVLTRSFRFLVVLIPMLIVHLFLNAFFMSLAIHPIP